MSKAGTRSTSSVCCSSSASFRNRRLLPSTLRHAASAAAAGVVIALAIDVVLQLLSTSIRLTGGPGPAAWARGAAYGVWLVLAGLVWATAPLVGAFLDDLGADAAASRRAIYQVIGTAFAVLPPLHVAAQLIVLALQLTLAGAWGSEGRIFLSGAYYGTVLLAVTPWVAAGVVLRAWATHLIDPS